jgi:hypothetical protein
VHDLPDTLHTISDFVSRKIPGSGGLQLDLEPGQHNGRPEPSFIGIRKLVLETLKGCLLGTNDGPR